LSCAVAQFLSGGRPSEGLVTGALLVAVAVSCMPLVFKFFSHTPGPPRLLALVLAAGLLIAVLQPPLPLKVLPTPPSKSKGVDQEGLCVLQSPCSSTFDWKALSFNRPCSHALLRSAEYTRWKGLIPVVWGADTVHSKYIWCHNRGGLCTALIRNQHRQYCPKLGIDHIRRCTSNPL
jgi:hypothetical protein